MNPKQLPEAISKINFENFSRIFASGEAPAYRQGRPLVGHTQRGSGQKKQRSMKEKGQMVFLRWLMIFFILSTGVINAQNFTTSSSSPPKCFGECNGTITFTTSSVSGPFTASLSNNGGCPNVITQTSSVNSITIDGICVCPGNYTCSIFNPSMTIVGSMVFQFLNYAAAPLIVNTNTFTAATCSNCCDGDVTFTVTGGNTTTAVTYSIDGVFNPSVNPTYFLCVGNHTVCVEDNSGCIACKVFYMPYVGGPTGINEISNPGNFMVSPNPVVNELFIETTNQTVSRVEIFDLTGRKVLSPKISGNSLNKIKFDVSSVNGGLYYIFVYSSNGELQGYKKFAKKD